MPRQRNIDWTPNITGDVPANTEYAIKRLYEDVRRVSLRVDSVESRPLPKIDVASIKRQLQAGGVAPLNLTGLIGQTAEPQQAAAPNFITLPDISSPAAQGGALARQDGILYVFDDSTNPGEWKIIGALGAIFQDTHANKVNYVASNYPIGVVFFETDRRVFYTNQGTFGSSAWKYVEGTFRDVLANIPTDLGTNDTFFKFYENSFDHILLWTGAGWQWGPGNPMVSGAGPIMWEIDPPTGSWALYDGGTYSYLKSDGTTANIVLPDLVAAGSNAAYLKAGSPNSGPNAAVAPTATGGGGTVNSGTTGITLPTNSGSNTTGITLPTNAGSNTTGLTVNNNVTTAAVDPVGGGSVASSTHGHSVTDPGHTHTMGSITDPGHTHTLGSITDPGHTHTFTATQPTISNTGEPRNLVRRPWFRR